MQITTLSHQKQQQKVRFPTWNSILGYSFHPHPARPFSAWHLERVSRDGSRLSDLRHTLENDFPHPPTPQPSHHCSLNVGGGEEDDRCKDKKLIVGKAIKSFFWFGPRKPEPSSKLNPAGEKWHIKKVHNISSKVTVTVSLCQTVQPSVMRGGWRWRGGVIYHQEVAGAPNAEGGKRKKKKSGNHKWNLWQAAVCQLPVNAGGVRN